jgi:hypothetical protein
MSDYKIFSRLDQRTIDGNFLEIVKKYPYDKRSNIKTLINVVSYDRTELFFRDFKSFSWIFPKPLNSNDPSGVSGDRSYDNKFFYYKDVSVWKRSPLAVFRPQRVRNSIEINFWYVNLPFVTQPRAALVPRRITDFGKLSEQTYDTYYFYTKTDSGWRRYPLSTFNPSKMTVF